MLKQLHCLGKRTHALLASLSLSDLDNIPEVTKALWTESTTTWPQLLRSDDCWTAPPPPVTDIILATLDALSEKKNDTTINFVAYRRGGSDASHDPRLAVAQLSEPNASNTAAIIGLNLDLLPEGIFESSPALSEFAEPFDESEQNLTLTPKYWVTDLHLGMFPAMLPPDAYFEAVCSEQQIRENRWLRRFQTQQTASRRQWAAASRYGSRSHQQRTTWRS